MSDANSVKSFKTLYEKNAQGIEIEGLKIKIEQAQEVFAKTISKMDITFPVNTDWVGSQTRIMDAEGRFVTFVSALSPHQQNAEAICELLNFAAANVNKSIVQPPT